MNRNAMKQLAQWKENGCTQPFLLYGTKGTGKTYLAIDFAKNYFSQYLYINFELNQDAREYFGAAILKGASVSMAVLEYFQLNLAVLPEILFIFDEISFCPVLVRAMEHVQEFPVVAVTSMFFEEQERKPFSCFCLYPLGFDEFLSAVGNEWYVDIIKGHFATKQPVPDIVHQELLALFEEYLTVGGMPAAVNEYISSGLTENVGEILYGLQTRTEHFLKSVFEDSDAAKALQVLKVVPEQLSRENKKFRLNSIRKGVTNAMYRDGIRALEKNGAVLKLNQQGNDNHFKLYLPDVGMLSAAFLGKNDVEIRKALLENYIMQTLCQSNAFTLSFWESKAKARVDFILKSEEDETPVELRISSSSKGKSVGVYLEGKTREQQKKYFRFGFENYYSTDVLINIPLYAIFCLL